MIPDDYRQKEQNIKEIHIKNQLVYQVSLAAIGILILTWIGSKILLEDTGYLTNIYTEALSILVTVGVIGFYTRYQSIQREKRSLILQMGSPNNAFAVEAARILRMQGWGWNTDSSLERQLFPFANLEGAYLGWCNLYGAQMEGAILTDSILRQANLKNANLRKVNLQGAFMLGANLENTRLMEADMRGVSLGPFLPKSVDYSLLFFFDETGRENSQNLPKIEVVNLAGANLCKANLSNAHLGSVNIDGADFAEAILEGVSDFTQRPIPHEGFSSAHRLVGAIMPDGTRYDGRLN